VAISSEAKSSCWVVIAPITMAMAVAADALEAGDAVQVNQMGGGAASRSFIIGTRLWPPASARASSPKSASNFTASATLAGLW